MHKYLGSDQLVYMCVRLVQIFDLFDLKRNGVIEFEEFVRSLHIFHPDTPMADKIACTKPAPFSSQYLCVCVCVWMF